MALRVSRSVVAREVQDQVMPRGLSFSQSSMVRTFWMLKVSSSKKNSLTWGKFSFAHFISAATSSVERLRQAWPERVWGQRKKVHCAGQPRVEQERNVVAGDVHVALVDFCGPGHRVEVLDLWTVGVVLDDAVGVFVADAEDFVEGLAVGVFYDGEVELAAADEIDDVAFVEGAVGIRGDGRTDEGDLDGGIRDLDGLG